MTGQDLEITEAVAVCTDCGHDIFVGCEADHDTCDAPITALIEEGLAELTEEMEVMTIAA